VNFVDFRIYDKGNSIIIKFVFLLVLKWSAI